MALQTIIHLVKRYLPFLPEGTTIIPGIGITVDQAINESICEQYYYLQSFTELTDAEVEELINYSMRQRMLIANLVAYYMICNETLKNVGGVAGEGVGEGGQQIKKGVADVVEVEFGYAKASDGNALIMSGEKLMAKFGARACELAELLGYALPLCAQLGYCESCDTQEPMPFMVFDNKDLNCKC